MKYLKRVILKNFQSHKNTEIDFDEGLNVILGPSDSGKSAIIRGIKWALYNEPSGDYFIKEGESQASVTLVFSDNTRVERIRSKSKNKYILYKKNGEEIIFEGFGLSVPEEIIEETGIRKIRLDSDESNAINLGEQLEGPFLLSEKNSTRAGAIGRLIGVNVIDDALKETLRDIRNKSNFKKTIEDRVEKIENELKEYEYLDDLKIRLNNVEELSTLIESKSKDQKLFISYFNRYNDLKKKKLLINGQLDQVKDIEAIDPLVRDLDKYINDLKYLNIKKENYISYRKEIDLATSLIEKLDGVDSAENIINKSNDLYTRVKDLNIIKNKLDKIVKEKDITNNIYNRLVNLPEVELKLKTIEKKPSTISQLVKLRRAYIEIQDNLNKGHEFIDKFQEVELSEKKYKEINLLAKKLMKLSDLFKELKTIQIDYKKENTEYNKLDEAIDKELDKYKEVLSKIEICPFCLSSIDNDKVEHIINHYN